MLCLSGFELYSRWEPLYSQNWECFDQSCVNRAETVHGTLRSLYLSHLLYGICVKIFIVNRIFQRATPRARILLTDNIHNRFQVNINQATLSECTESPKCKTERCKNSGLLSYVYSSWELNTILFLIVHRNLTHGFEFVILYWQF